MTLLAAEEVSLPAWIEGQDGSFFDVLTPAATSPGSPAAIHGEVLASDEG